MTAGSNCVPDAGAQLAGRVLDAPGLLVGALVHEDVEDVGDVDEPRLERDRLAREAVGIAAAVPALVVRAGDPLRDAEHLRLAVGEHARAEHRVRLDDLELLVGELAGLEQDRVRDRDLAEVVQRRGLADEPDEAVVHAHVARHPGGERADPLGVLGRVVVAVLRRQREPLERVEADRLRVAERAERLAGDDRLQLAEAAAHRPVLEHEREPADRAARRAGRRAVSSASGTTGGPLSSPSGSSFTRTASGSVSPSERITCGCAAAAWAATSSTAGTRSTEGLPAAVSSRTKGLGFLAVPADNQHAGAGEDVVIHTQT